MPQSGWDVMPFLLGATAVALILTGFFNATRRSILVAILFHWELNMPMCPDSKPWGMHLFAVLAAIIVRITRAEMPSRAGAVTKVMPGRQEARR